MKFFILALLLARQDPGDLIEKLRSDHVDERDDAALRLRALGNRALPALDRAARDADSEVAARARQIGREVRGLTRLTRHLLETFPNLEDRLSSGDDHDWTEVLLYPIGKDATNEDLEPLAARAVRGAATADEKVRVCLIIRSRSLQSATAELVALLKDADANVRVMAINTLREAKPDATVPAAIGLLKHPAYGFRLWAADYLWKLGSAEAVGPLTKLLADREGGVRGTAVQALAALENRAATPKLLLVLRLDPDGWVRLQAARALAELRGAEAAPVIAGLLSDPDPTVRFEALDRLEEWGARAVSPEVARLLRDPSAAVRGRAAETLSSLNSKEGRADLLALLRDDVPSVRESAARAVGDLRVEEAVAGAMRLLRDPAPGVRIAAATSLGRLRARESVPKLIEVLDDEETQVRHAALGALVLLEAREALPRCSEILKSRRRPEDHQAICAAVANLNGRDATSALLDFAREGDWPAIQALGRLGAREAIPAIREQLAHDNLFHRHTAAIALLELGAADVVPQALTLLTHQGSQSTCRCDELIWSLANAGTKEAIPVLRQLLNAGNHGAPAARALGAMGARDAVPELLKLAEEASSDGTAAAEALGRLGAREGIPAMIELVKAGWADAAGALEALDAGDHADAIAGLLDSTDDEVRFAAASALCRLGSRRGVPVLLESAPRRERVPSLCAMNVLYRKNAWDRLARTRVPTRPAGGSVGALLRPLEERARIKVEPADDPRVRDILDLPPRAPTGPKEGSALDALTRGPLGTLEFILEKDSVRIVTRDEALRFWREWWEGERKKK